MGQSSVAPSCVQTSRNAGEVVVFCNVLAGTDSNIIVIIITIVVVIIKKTSGKLKKRKEGVQRLCM